MVEEGHPHGECEDADHPHGDDPAMTSRSQGITTQDLRMKTHGIACKALFP